jgi:hypothetical protein
VSDTFTICFRLPIALRAPLTKLAVANRRSINAEVVIAIEAHVETAKFLASDTIRGLQAIGNKLRKPVERAKGKR